MIRNDDSIDRQMLLAEFTALRAEILHNSNLAWNIFALQVTAAGIIFSFALGNRNHIGFLLILPVITYAFSGRYVGQIVDVLKIGTYIREVLEVKTKGDLHWEEWTRSRPSRLGTLTLLNPLFLIFPGVAVVAIAWVAPFVWTSQDVSAGMRVLIVIIWFVDIVVTVLSFELISRIVSRRWRRTWRRRFDKVSESDGELTGS
jgi:hypothetical protein